MKLKKISFKTGPTHAARRLDQVLAESLPSFLGEPISKAKVRKLIIAGAVYLNRKRVRIASKELLPSVQIDVYIDTGKLNAGTDLPLFAIDSSHILFEDEWLIAISKPPGLPTQPTLDEARNNLYQSVKKGLADREKISINEVYLGLHHRLDRDTSGVILFTKVPQVNREVGQLFSEHRIQKVYRALSSIEGSRLSSPVGLLQPGAEWKVENYLSRLKTTGKKAKFGSVRSGGDFALTQFRCLQRFGSGALEIEALPKTGRTHQIRVHLSEAGMPILGDLTYGGLSAVKGLQIPRLMLHAMELRFEHPITRAEILIECPLPSDFSSVLARLKNLQSPFGGRSHA